MISRNCSTTEWKETEQFSAPFCSITFQYLEHIDVLIQNFSLVYCILRFVLKYGKNITLLHNISERQRSSRYSPNDHRRTSRERSRSRLKDLRYHDDNRHGSRNRSRDRERSKTRDDRIDRRSRDSHVSFRHGHGGHGLHGTSHGHDRHRSHRDRSRDRRKGGDGRSRHEKADKFKDSLSEGQKKAASSDSDVEVEIDINEDDEDEEAIIERRRKQREELLKVKFLNYIQLKFIYLFEFHSLKINILQKKH